MNSAQQPTTTSEWIGWKQHGHKIETPEGYSVEYYFDAEGKYLGPDEDGIEPMFA